MTDELTQRTYRVYTKRDQLVDDAPTEEEALELVEEFDDYDVQSAPHYYEEQ